MKHETIRQKVYNRGLVIKDDLHFFSPEWFVGVNIKKSSDEMVGAFIRTNPDGAQITEDQLRKLIQHLQLIYRECVSINSTERQVRSEIEKHEQERVKNKQFESWDYVKISGTELRGIVCDTRIPGKVRIKDGKGEIIRNKYSNSDEWPVEVVEMLKANDSTYQTFK